MAFLSWRNQRWVGLALSHMAVAFCLGLGVISLSGEAIAKTIVLSDVDDTLLETRQHKKGTFKTPYRLYRIDHRGNTIQSTPDGPREISVSPIDFERIRPLLGRGNYEFGNISNFTLEDGRVVIPGHYMVVDPDTFAEYNSVEGKNILLEHFNAAEKRDPKYGWRGEFWDKLVVLLSNAEWAKSLGVLTARGHSRADWEGLFKELKKRGYIEHLPNFDLFHNVSLRNYDRFGLAHEIAKRKIGVLEQTIKALARVPFDDAHEVLHPDGKGTIKHHFLIFADDNQQTLAKAEALFKSWAMSKNAPIKFGLFNMGTENDVRASGRSRYAIFDSSGVPRSATMLERVGEPAGLTEERMKEILASEACARVISKTE